MFKACLGGNTCSAPRSACPLLGRVADDSRRTLSARRVRLMALIGLGSGACPGRFTHGVLRSPDGPLSLPTRCPSSKLRSREPRSYGRTGGLLIGRCSKLATTLDPLG